MMDRGLEDAKTLGLRRTATEPFTIDKGGLWRQVIRTVIVSPFALTRRALRIVLEQDWAFEIVGEAESPETCLEQLKLHTPDIVIVDMFGIDGAGLDELAAIREACPKARIVVIAEDSDDDRCVRMLRMGVSGCVLSSAETEYLRETVRAVMAGEVVVHPALTRGLVAQLASPEFRRQRSAPLTPREITIVRALAEGLSDRQIAQRMSIAASTVKIHLRAVYQKLGLRNRVQAVTYAATNGLLAGRSS
jgi:DNA-binding NarL/FixJ family response regulator